MWKDVEGVGGDRSLGAFLIARSASDASPAKPRTCPEAVSIDLAYQRMVVSAL